MVLVFGEIFRLGGLRPSIVRQGNKLYEMVIEKRDVVNTTIFRDTYDFSLYKIVCYNILYL